MPGLNIRFGKALLESVDGRRAIRDLIPPYFGLGGRQTQLSVVDSDVLADALVHLAQHEDLIVRVGGVCLLHWPDACAQAGHPGAYGVRPLSDGIL